MNPVHADGGRREREFEQTEGFDGGKSVPFAVLASFCAILSRDVRGEFLISPQNLQIRQIRNGT
ncbi:MAG TPA: hypothetical protein DC058_02595 [Planctomycetaceae bacterium]|nr:hypothetical protein [Planctomycetaceae bacterium]